MEDSVANSREYLCPFPDCNVSYTSVHRLEVHQLCHSSERVFVCTYPECNKSYTRKEHLNRHVVISHPSSSTPKIQCSACSIVVKTVENLKKHMKRFHESERYKCTHCGKQFKKLQHLKIHEYNHTGVKPFVCSAKDCNKSFVLPSKLRRHEKIHEGYKCTGEGCSESFETWTLLVNHKKLFHKRKIDCKTCGRVFQTMHNLKTHMLSHANLREAVHCPFDNCPRFYFHKKNLDQHIRKFHEEKNLLCPTEGCGKTFFNRSKLKHHLNAKLCFQRKSRKKIAKRHKRSMASKLSGYVSDEVDNVTAVNIDSFAIETSNHTEAWGMDNSQPKDVVTSGVFAVESVQRSVA